MAARFATRRIPRTASVPTVKLRLSVPLSDRISASPSLTKVSSSGRQNSSFLAQTSPKEDPTSRQGYVHGGPRTWRAWTLQPKGAASRGPARPSWRPSVGTRPPAALAASLYFAHGGAGGHCLQTAGMKTLYRATRIYTLGHPAVGEWLLVDGRHVERVGVGDPPLADREVDLGGTTIIPGFIDTHVHLTGTTLSAIGIPLERARSQQELLGLVAEELTHGPTKVLAHGFDESRWDRPDLPVATELDELGDVPIILIRA